MVTISNMRKLALSFDDVIELPHFEKSSFRIKKKIFATIDFKNKRAMLKLSAIDQFLYCTVDPAAIYPVPGGWGKKGATYFDLGKVKKGVFAEAMKLAYLFVKEGR